MMSAVRGSGNKAEIALRHALHRLGFRYRLRGKKLLGRPDIILTRYCTVIFIDGDYWHGRALLDGGDAQLRQVIRGPRYDWWRAKLTRNIERDREVTKALRDEGWRVIRVWESDVLANLDGTVARVVRAIRARPSALARSSSPRRDR
jgi:DNA mismatch endonuclease (patch repair protein)